MHLRAELYSGEILEYNCSLSTFVIGRSPKCEVVIPIEGVSRNHIKVELIHGDIYVTDLNSANGVVIDNERVQPSKKIKYQTFFHLAFGPVKNFQISFEQTSVIKLAEHPADMVTPVPKRSPDQIQMKPRRAGFEKKKEEKKTGPSKVMNFVALAIILAVIYHVYNLRHSGKPKVKEEVKAPKQVNDEYF